MNHRRIAHQILARLPTHVNNVSVRYIDSLVRRYARKEKDFSVIKRIINQNERRHLIMVKQYKTIQSISLIIKSMIRVLRQKRLNRNTIR